MSYQRASNLRSQGLGSLMMDRIVSGRGVGKSIRSAISDKTKAKLIGIKEKFDPMNIAKAFGGRLGAYAMGKMTGRSTEDMAHFTGAPYRRSNVLEPSAKMNPMITKVSEGDTKKMKKGDGLADVMSRIYNLIKADILVKRQHEEIQKKFSIDKQNQREQWHKDLITALTGSSKVTVASIVAPEKAKGGLFDGLTAMIEKIIGSVKDIMETIDFFKILKKLNIFSILTNVAKLLASPIGLLALGIIGGTKFLEFINSKTPDGTVLTPDQAQAVLEGGSPDQIQKSGGRQKLEQTIKTGQQQARDIQAMPAGAEKDKAVLAAGGAAQVKAVAEDTKTYTVPAYNPENDRVPPKPKMNAGSAGTQKTAAWMKEYSEDYNDDGSRKTAAAVTPTTPTASTVPAEPSPATQNMQNQVNKNNAMKLDESSAPKIITIDNSKTSSIGGGGPGAALSMDSSILVRTDDNTLQNILKKNTWMV